MIRRVKKISAFSNMKLPVKDNHELRIFKMWIYFWGIKMWTMCLSTWRYGWRTGEKGGEVILVREGEECRQDSLRWVVAG